MAIRIAPTLAEMASYPFVRLEEARRALVARGVEVIDFGKGDPNEPTDSIIRKALVDAVPERAPYPLAADLALKEQALNRTTPLGGTPGRYRPPDDLLAFLEAL